MKAIKYQGRLWIPTNKCHTIEHPVFDVDELELQCRRQAMLLRRLDAVQLQYAEIHKKTIDYLEKRGYKSKIFEQKGQNSE